MKTKIVPLLFLLLLISSSNYFSQTESSSDKKIYSVIVMPFVSMERYPYSTDLVREGLMLGFYQRGFYVVMNDSIWAHVLELDMPFYNINDAMADSISKTIGVDLVVFGNIKDGTTMREGGLYANRPVSRPILIKIFDAKKKKIILHERTDFIEYWGLFTKQNDIFDFGIKIATKLSSMGY